MRKDLLSYDLVCSGTARESMCSCYFAFRIPLPMTSSKNRVDDAAVNSRARQLFTMMRLFLTMVAYVTHFEGRVQTPDIGVITRFTSVWSRTTSRWTSNRQTSHPAVGILTSHPPPPPTPCTRNTTALRPEDNLMPTAHAKCDTRQVYARRYKLHSSICTSRE